MLEHQKDTVSCVASGKEQHISMEDIYEMSQTKNKRYRWKHAFQLPSLCQTDPNCLRYLKDSAAGEEEFSARIRMECAETAFKLKIYVKKYSAALEEESMKRLNAETLRKKELHKQSASHSTNIP